MNLGICLGAKLSRVPGIIVENIETTGKTLPDFTYRWEELLNK